MPQTWLADGERAGLRRCDIAVQCRSKFTPVSRASWRVCMRLRWQSHLDALPDKLDITLEILGRRQMRAVPSDSLEA